MARDLEVVRRCCSVNDAEAALLAATAAPIVLLDRVSTAARPYVVEEVAPNLIALGFMLPNTPLHHLLLKRMGRPIVLTSGNLSDEPQAITRDDAHNRLGGIAEYLRTTPR